MSCKIKINVHNPNIRLSIGSDSSIGLSVSQAKIVYIGGKPYSGEYEATPTQETQIFSTAGKLMNNNFVVHPIPQNYGLITYNGFEIMVS